MQRLVNIGTALQRQQSEVVSKATNPRASKTRYSRLAAVTDVIVHLLGWPDNHKQLPFASCSSGHLTIIIAMRLLCNDMKTLFD